MAVTLTGTGGLYTRLGKLGLSYLRVVSGYGSTLNTEIANVDAQYASNDQLSTDLMYTNRDSYRGVHGTYLSALTSIAANTVIEQVNRDTPLAAKTLTNALTELFLQQDANTSTIQRPTTTLTVTPDAGNLGDSVVVGSLTNEYGETLDLVFDEDIKLKCTSDAASGGSQYQETVTVAGEPLLGVTDYQWPGGSGATGSFTLFDAAIDSLIDNADFADWSGSPLAPDSWTIQTGTAASTIVRAADTLRSGTNYTLSFVSDGSVLHDIYQVVDLKPNTVYCFNCWAKTSVLDSSAIFRVRLTNGSNVTINNDAGTTNLYTRNLNGNIGTTYTQVYTYFQTPRQLPTTVRLHLEMTVTATSGRILYIGLAGFKAARQLYAGGPFLDGFSKGATNPTAKGDKWVAAVTSTANAVSFARMLERFFSLRSLGLYPVSATSTPTIADSLLQ